MMRPMSRVTATIRRRPLVSILVGVALLAVVVVGAFLVVTRGPWSEEGIGLTALVPAPAGSTLSVPRRGHVWVVVFENKDDNEIIGSKDAPFFNELISKGAVTEAYQGIAHPSQPNYLALVSGSTQGILDNDAHTVDAPTVFDQLDAAGLDWRVAAENVPPGCFQGATATGGADGPGTYARKHEPAITFQSISSDPQRCARIVGFSSFQADAAPFQLVIPHLCHDMHDCGVSDGDAWLRSFIPRITDSPAFQQDGLLVITFDEGVHGDQDNDVTTVVLGPGVKPGFVTSVPHSHYSLLRTIQEALGLPCLAASCDANTLGEVFQ